jgi:hypothetical protein
MEPLAYELDWQIAWKLLPVSAVIEMTAVVFFALNLVGTLMQKPAHLRQLSEPIRNQGGTHWTIIGPSGASFWWFLKNR